MSSRTQCLFIEPLDVWLFRNGRPFNKDEDHTAQGIFPPLPITMQGVLRTHHLAVNRTNLHQAKEIRALVGTREKYPEGFQLTGPFVARRENGAIVRYFPRPQDLYLDVQQGTYRTFALRQPNDIYTDLTQQPETAHLQLLYRQSTEKPEKESTEGGSWISETALQSYYLQGKDIPQAELISSSQLFATENRIGIGIDSTHRTTEEGLLYEVKFTRPTQNTGLWVEVSGLTKPGQTSWSQTGVIALGGEARAGRYEMLPEQAWQLPQPHSVATNGRFKILFLTPTYFSHGWQSENWQQFFTTEVKLQAVALGRPIVWGGRNLAERQHEPSYRYIPAGSVYHFQGQPTLKLPYITDRHQKFGPIGFGQFVIGGY